MTEMITFLQLFFSGGNKIQTKHEEEQLHCNGWSLSLNNYSTDISSFDIVIIHSVLSCMLFLPPTLLASYLFGAVFVVLVVPVWVAAVEVGLWVEAVEAAAAQSVSGISRLHS